MFTEEEQRLQDNIEQLKEENRLLSLSEQMTDNAIEEIHKFFDMEYNDKRHIIDAVCIAGNKYKQLKKKLVDCIIDYQKYYDKWDQLKELLQEALSILCETSFYKDSAKGRLINKIDKAIGENG